MPNYSKKIVYLSKEQYQELITNNSVTANGVTVNYNENDIYVTPQAEPITDVKVNGTSIGSNGIANIPKATVGTLGVAQTNYMGVETNENGELYVNKASSTNIKEGTNNYKPIVPSNQHESVFYGLSKAAGDFTQISSDNIVGTYTDTAKSAIQQMLGAQAAIEVIRL